MSAPLSVELTLYGAFRAHVGGTPLRLTLPAGATPARRCAPAPPASPTTR
jgi:hypothetical protein